MMLIKRKINADSRQFLFGKNHFLDRLPDSTSINFFNYLCIAILKKCLEY
jgi:hypothetical protein